MMRKYLLDAKMSESLSYITGNRKGKMGRGGEG
jgi:hypothetical protein